MKFTHIDRQNPVTYFRASPYWEAVRRDSCHQRACYQAGQLLQALGETEHTKILTQRAVLLQQMLQVLKRQGSSAAVLPPSISTAMAGPMSILRRAQHGPLMRPHHPSPIDCFATWAPDGFRKSANWPQSLKTATVRV